LKSALSKTKLEDLDEFLDKCLNKSFGTALIIGNYDARAAGHLIGVIENTFPFEDLEYGRRSRRRIYYTPESKFGLRLVNLEPNEKDENSATSFYFQVPSRNIEDYMLAEMLAEVIEQPFYDDLRTKQQLGYIVGSGNILRIEFNVVVLSSLGFGYLISLYCTLLGARGREGVVSLTLTVQSSIVDGYELTKRVEDFIQDRFLPSLDSLTEKEFEVSLSL
jgi:secreted Zn-dependent insulinase-like peptidase